MRRPDVSIGDNYLDRWYVIPRNQFMNIYLHKFSSSDDDRAMHDHPWWSLSVLLMGQLLELSKKHSWRQMPKYWPVIRSAKFAHRLEVIDGPVWTIFITGPKIRDWGFHCPNGWRHWSAFTTADGRNVGRGCE